MSPLLGKIRRESFMGRDWRESVPIAGAGDLRELEILSRRVPGLGPPLLVSQPDVLETV